MSKIQFSINNSYENAAEAFQPILNTFEQQDRIDVSLVVYDWESAWDELMKISLYGHGPIISQTGNSLMGSLIARKNLRVFKGREIMELRKQMNFLPGSWQSCLDFDNESVLAIPWILDTYLVYYRRDLLEKAGINQATAFSTAENFHSTLAKLQESGINYPFAVPTHARRSLIHVAASWVWGQGGDFTDLEGTRVLFSKPETRKGLEMYFGLCRFMSPEAKQLDDEHSWNLFRNGKTAVTMRNAELLFRLKHQELPAEFADTVGVAVVPGVPLLGGSNLIVWNHIRPEQEENALDLIKFLTSTEAEVMLFEIAGLLPASLDALERIDPTSIFAAAIQSVKTGRAFHRIRIWGLVEEKLVIALSQIWDALLSTPNPDVKQTIADYLDPVETKLNIILSQ